MIFTVFRCYNEDDDEVIDLVIEADNENVTLNLNLTIAEADNLRQQLARAIPVEGAYDQ